MRGTAGFWFVCACSSAPVARPVVAVAPVAATTAPPDASIDAAAPTADLGPSAALLARLPIREGPIPGTPFTVRTDPSTTDCGGVSVFVDGDVNDPTSLEDIEDYWFFSDVMTLEMPNPDDRDGLDAWATWAYGQMGNAGLDLRSELEREDVTPKEKVMALARLVELYRHFVETFARAWIPTDMLDDENRATWCDGLAEQVRGGVDQMELYAAECRAAAKEAKLTGWWDEACAAR